MDSEQETAARVDLDVLMEQMRGYPPTRIAEAMWGWMEAQGFRGEAHAPTDDDQEALRIAELNARQAAYRKEREDWFVDHEAEPEIASNAFFRGWDAAVGGGFRRSEVPEPSAEEDESAPGECDGSGTCSAARHIHGCYTRHRADQCDAPEEYGHLPAEPQGEPSDAQVAAIEQRVYDQNRGQIAGMAKALVRAGWDAALAGVLRQEGESDAS